MVRLQNFVASIVGSHLIVTLAQRGGFWGLPPPQKENKRNAVEALQHYGNDLLPVIHNPFIIMTTLPVTTRTSESYEATYEVFHGFLSYFQANAGIVPLESPAMDGDPSLNPFICVSVRLINITIRYDFDVELTACRRLRWAGHVAHMGESRNKYRVLVGRQEEIKPLERLTRRWEDNIKMDLREMGYDDRDWINLTQTRDRCRVYVRAAMNLRVP
ncbi:hypothetical protein ANN_11166 [Periplaneta americana]|uniref:Uncharacterized protein n=1 Tax=Periplaneta americana TaxID=6978 RepID=A0ABQ8T488_PERAM|nr:hypothetical protein ANN_11166 [Periplaneta americana]